MFLRSRAVHKVNPAALPTRPLVGSPDVLLGIRPVSGAASTRVSPSIRSRGGESTQFPDHGATASVEVQGSNATSEATVSISSSGIQPVRKFS